MRAMRTAWITLAFVGVATAALTAAGCGSPGTPSAGPAPAAALTTPPTKAVPTTPAPSSPTAKQVLTKLTAAGLPMSNGTVQDENTDPNNLIGRPNGYLSRASFDVQGADTSADKYTVERGGVIEVFTDAAAAQARSKYIQDTLKALGPVAGTEYHYIHGTALVRIYGLVKPSVAAKFDTAVAALTP